MKTTTGTPGTVFSYRKFLWTPMNSGETKVVLLIVSREENQRQPREKWAGFVRWVGSWQNVAIRDSDLKTAERLRGMRDAAPDQDHDPHSGMEDE